VTSKGIFATIKRPQELSYCFVQGDHSPGKHGKPQKVREFQSGQGKGETVISFIIQLNYQ